MQKKIQKKVFRFWYNSIWKCCNKLPLLRRQYLSSPVNGLTRSPKILHITQRNFFNTNYFLRDQKVWWRCCRSALNSISGRLPCYLMKSPLKPVFLDIYLTTFFRVIKLKNASAMRVIFSSKMFKIESKFRNCLC